MLTWHLKTAQQHLSSVLLSTARFLCCHHPWMTAGVILPCLPGFVYSLITHIQPGWEQPSSASPCSEHCVSLGRAEKRAKQTAYTQHSICPYNPRAV